MRDGCRMGEKEFAGWMAAGGMLEVYFGNAAPSDLANLKMIS